MRIENTDLFTIIHPDEGHKLSNLDKTEMCEGSVYLGIYDSPENYIEVTIEEYNEWRNKEQEPIVDNEATKEDLYNALAELGVKEND